MNGTARQRRGWCGARPAVAVWLRGLMTLLAAGGGLAAFIEGRALVALGCMNVMAGDVLIFLVAIPCAFLAMFSCLVAFGLHRGSTGWMRTALVFDLLAVMLLLSALGWFARGHWREGSNEAFAESLWMGGGMGGALLLCAAEAASLMHACRRSRTAWPVFGLLVLVTVALAVIVPFRARALHLRHVAPLVDHLRAYWFRVPSDAEPSVSITHDGAGGHTDWVDLRAGDRSWSVWMRHDADGNWRAVVSDVVASGHGPAPAEGDPDPVGSALRAARIVPVDVGTNAAVVVIDRQTFSRLSAPAAGGCFDVSAQGGVLFRLEQPLTIPGGAP